MGKRYAVLIGSKEVSITGAQLALYRAVQMAPGKMIFIQGADVRSARVLQSLGFGKLEDYGGAELHDGERWSFELADVLIQPAPVRAS